MKLNIFWDLPAYLLAILLVFSVIILFDLVISKKRGYYKKKKSAVVRFARDLFWVVFIVFVLRAFVIEPFRIPSGSMIPNLLIGDFVLVNKSSYTLNLPLFNYPVFKFSNIKRGDIVVFRYPIDPNIPFIKRVIGLPGDTLAYRNKTLYINGKKIKDVEMNSYDSNSVVFDEYLNKKPITILRIPYRFDRRNKQLENGFIVPEKSYFVMGDNRDNSNDSRYWGFVPERNILGKALLVWANITTDGSLLSLNPDEWLKFFTTFKLSFDSAGKLKTGAETTSN